MSRAVASGLSSSPKKLYIIAGPTAVGKTKVSIELAKRLNTAIISADSRQCYREMNIGTAKPSKEEMEGVKHYFIDEFPVTENVSAAEFEELALNYLDEIFSKSDSAVVCGGTGLYIRALTDGLDEMPGTDEETEAEANEQYKAEGLAWLQEAVKSEDPVFYSEGEIQNPARLLRALIFKRSTGKSITEYRSGEKKERNFRPIKIALTLSRDVLYERINKRVDEMMRLGLLDEVRQLYPYKHLKNLQTVGYSELFHYLDDKSTLEQAVDKMKQHTRNYAKRQLTWFRKDKEMHWMQADDPHIIENILAL